MIEDVYVVRNEHAGKSLLIIFIRLRGSLRDLRRDPGCKSVDSYLYSGVVNMYSFEPALETVTIFRSIALTFSSQIVLFFYSSLWTIQVSKVGTGFESVIKGFPLRISTTPDNELEDTKYHKTGDDNNNANRAVSECNTPHLCLEQVRHELVMHDSLVILRSRPSRLCLPDKIHTRVLPVTIVYTLRESWLKTKFDLVFEKIIDSGVSNRWSGLSSNEMPRNKASTVLWPGNKRLFRWYFHPIIDCIRWSKLDVILACSRRWVKKTFFITWFEIISW